MYIQKIQLKLDTLFCFLSVFVCFCCCCCGWKDQPRKDLKDYILKIYSMCADNVHHLPQSTLRKQTVGQCIKCVFEKKGKDQRGVHRAPPSVQHSLLKNSLPLTPPHTRAHAHTLPRCLSHAAP